MKRIILIFATLSITFGCATPARLYEDMLPNGHWAIWIYSDDASGCNSLFEKYETLEREEKAKKEGKELTFSERLFASTGDRSERKCIDLFKINLRDRSRELCQNDNAIIYGCVNSADDAKSAVHFITAGDAKKLRCYVDCNKQK